MEGGIRERCLPLCHGRGILRTLRERHAQGAAAGAPESRDGGENAIIVVSHPSEIGGLEWPVETAAIMRFRDSKVVSMQGQQTKPNKLFYAAAREPKQI
jgi:hypothetical protein